MTSIIVVVCLIQWLFQRADADKMFSLKSMSQGHRPSEFLSICGGPTDGAMLMIGKTHHWRIEEESGVDGGVRCVGLDASSVVLHCIHAFFLWGGSKTDDVSMICCPRGIGGWDGRDDG